MEIVGVYSYFVAGIFFSLLLLLLITTGLKSFNSKILLCAIGASIVWSFHVYFSIQYNIQIYFTFLTELIKNSLWGLLCISLLTKSSSIRELFTPNHQLYWFYFIPLIALSVDLVFSFQLMNNTVWLYLAQLIQSISLLIIVEYLYRQGSSDFRWGFKPIAVIIAVIATVDFILYSTAVLLQHIDIHLFLVRGGFHVLLTPVLLVGVKRFKSLGVRIFVSREVVFHSTILIAISIYLTLMAATGYYLNFIGAGWSSYSQISFTVLALVILIFLFINETIRSRIKVFITKHFFANRYDYRQQWLSLNNCLDNPPSENYYHTALFAITQLFGINHGILFKINHNAKVQATINYDGDLSPWINFLNQYQHDKNQWIIDLDEYERYPDTYPTKYPHIDSIIGQNLKIIIPIFNHGNIIGYYVLSRPSHQELVNYEDRDLLITASQQLANYIALNEASTALSEAKQFDTFNQMSAFLVHDLKNEVGQLSLISTIATHHRDNPEFILDAFETVDNSVVKINKMLNQLRQKRPSENTAELVNIKPILINLCTQYSIKFQTAYTSNEMTLCIDDDKLSNILEHLIQNAQQAISQSGKVILDLAQSDSNCIISIIDDGCGMSSEFVKTRLFKPFDTTKGNAGMGIGAYEAKHFIESLGGEVMVESAVDQGTRISLVIAMPEITTQDE